LFEIRHVEDKTTPLDNSNKPIDPADRARLDHLHVQFATCLDDLPPQLLPPALAAYDENSLSHKHLATQISNLQITYNCLRMQILERLEAVGYFNPLDNHMNMLLLHKTEIAHDVVRYIQEAPFWSLQVNGEPCVRDESNTCH
jgi:hypothetical protein